MANNEQKRKRNTAIILILIFIIGIAAGFAYGRFAGKDNNPTTEPSSTSTTATSTTKPTTTETTTAAEDESTTETTTAKTTKPTTIDAGDLPLTVNTAMDALEARYGRGYEINSTVEDGGLNYFSVYKNDEKYASVAVNLRTGDATETRMSDGKKTNFSLVK
jgi:cytoskeletal protein RodZ